MRRNRWTGALTSLALALLAIAPMARAQAAPAGTFDAVAESRAVIAALGAGKFTEVEARYSPEMVQALPAGQLATAWGQLTTQAGKLTLLGEPTVEDQNGIRVVTFPATYEHLTVSLILAWTADHKLGGLLARPQA